MPGVPNRPGAPKNADSPVLVAQAVTPDLGDIPPRPADKPGWLCELSVGARGMQTSIRDGAWIWRYRRPAAADRAYAAYCETTWGMMLDEVADLAIGRPIRLDPAPGGPGVPAGWSRDGWIARLRQMAGGCQEANPSQAEAYRRQADEIEQALVFSGRRGGRLKVGAA